MVKSSFRSLRNRILILFVAIIFVFTMVVVLTTGSFTRSLVNGVVQQNVKLLVQSYADSILIWQEERKQALQQLANNELVETLDWEQIEPFLQRQIKAADDFHLIYFVATPDGNYHSTAQRNAGNLSTREYFSRVMAGETIISSPVISHSLGTKIIVIATPIYAPNSSEVIGLLGLSYSLKGIYENPTQSPGDPLENTIYIMDQAGYFVRHPIYSLVTTARLQDYYPNWDTLNKEEFGFYDYKFKGVNYRAFHHPIGTKDNWSILVEIPMSLLTDPIKQLMYYLLIVSVLGFILAFFSASWFASSITAPIIELNEVFRQGAAGDLTVRAKINRQDELGETSRSFNSMMDTIGTMTYYDPLTKLPNRHYFLDYLAHCLEENETVILALISIRGLSEFNTLLGPKVTDSILLHLAEVLQKASDDEIVVAKIADADFGVVIPAGTTGVLAIIDRLDNILSQPMRLENENLDIHLFGGISISEDTLNLTANSFYQQAQAALFDAEHSTTEQLKLYNPSTHHAMVDRIRFQSEIRTALDEHQFTVYYQPVIDLKTSQAIGKEALIRWKHPKKGILAPSEFLEIAEQAGFIEEIGEYMINLTLKQHYTWREQGFNPHWVAVNISAKQFRSIHFPSFIQASLKRYGVPPHMLKIEITEDTMLAPTTEVLNNFQELRKLGVAMSIDDFGTAYSSLEYLIRYPMETLKIDRTFISNLDLNLRTHGLVRSIIGIGQNLNMDIVAEGVERYEQVRILQEMGCHKAQGYYFSRPIPWEDYPAFVSDLNKRLRRDGFLD